MKSVHLAVRISETLDKRLTRVPEGMMIEKPTLVRGAVEALVNYVEKNGRITFPLVLVEPGYDELPKAAEDSTPYGSSEPGE